jgi:hypothetical protein
MFLKKPDGLDQRFENEGKALLHASIEIVSQDLPAGDASPCPAPVLPKPAIKFLDHRDEARVLFLTLGPFTNIET